MDTHTLFFGDFTTRFIETHITRRKASLCEKDLAANRRTLEDLIEARDVLVIGGAGTIGSSFIEATLPYNPRSFIVVDHNENALTELVRNLRSLPVRVPQDIKTYAVDFGGETFKRILDANAVDIVAHFAAHKHVRSEKDVYSVEALLKNNVIKTHKLLELCLNKNIKRFFGVSTDKASDPVNVMGASKKLMEEMIFAYQDQVHVTSARFANVAFSNGSLLLGFIERIHRRQPLAAPKDIMRYFVSPKESGEICLLAGLCGNSGETLFPKLAPEGMVGFYDLAVSLVEALGFEPLVCHAEQEAKLAAEALAKGSMQYPILATETQTTGEKTVETFFGPGERVEWDRFESLGVISKSLRRAPEAMKAYAIELERMFEAHPSKQTVIEKLKEIVTAFKHDEKHLYLDQNM